ncbi:hypothetical protein AAL_04473 [Moelleriella libera RCEF 2490]|uniref:Uncharacterized protein n=1 Tax=Moelleriella libera RCEF 2490 TaxID=1081109 RepID=A0A162IJU3_9HYPO|nr:hypothetical protein AAL_04473 [Moelleriella libera RCEF 2490]
MPEFWCRFNGCYRHENASLRRPFAAKWNRDRHERGCSHQPLRMPSSFTSTGVHQEAPTTFASILGPNHLQYGSGVNNTTSTEPWRFEGYPNGPLYHNEHPTHLTLGPYTGNTTGTYIANEGTLYTSYLGFEFGLNDTIATESWHFENNLNGPLYYNEHLAPITQNLDASGITGANITHEDFNNWLQFLH